MDTDDIFCSAIGLARRIAARELSPVELVETCLERIDRLDGRLGSFVTLVPDRAMADARAAEARAGTPDAPPFDGVPIAIKDLHLTAGVPTTFGSSAMAGFVPDFDEEHVARIRRSGFVVVGKTNVPEWGTVPVTEPDLHGPARNPWSLQHTPGGSSGGTAAAVAAGLVPIGQGSDGGGSIRIPASNCGLFGLKPARGRVSLAPLYGDQMGGLTTPGPLTRHVEDAAALLDAMRGYVAGDPYWAPEPPRPYLHEVVRCPPRLRVGLVTATPQVEFDPETVAAAEQAAATLEDLGHVVEPFALPVPDSLRDDFVTVWRAGVATLPLEPEQLEPFNAHLMRRGRATSGHTVLRAITGLQAASRTLVGASLAYDAVVSPTLARPPVPVGAFRGLAPDEAFRAAERYVGLTPLANITGLPSMSLPLGWSADGLPLGVMVTGRPADEATLFRLAAQVQQAADWTRYRPPVR